MVERKAGCNAVLETQDHEVVRRVFVHRVRRSLRDKGAVVVEIYYIGNAPVVIVEHAGDAWFSDITLPTAAMRDGSPVVSKFRATGCAAS
tara:strand:- start:914 stop:1183 length:270 start_codon:yes stop_codon:yes gene_type:complete